MSVFESRRPQPQKLSRGVPFDLDGVGALAPVFETHTSNEPQLCSANCAIDIPGAANIDQSYRKGNTEKHTGENNAKACHDVPPLEKTSINNATTGRLVHLVGGSLIEDVSRADVCRLCVLGTGAAALSNSATARPIGCPVASS